MCNNLWICATIHIYNLLRALYTTPIPEIAYNIHPVAIYILKLRKYSLSEWVNKIMSGFAMFHWLVVPFVFFIHSHIFIHIYLFCKSREEILQTLKQKKKTFSSFGHKFYASIILEDLCFESRKIIISPAYCMNVYPKLYFLFLVKHAIK